MENEIKSARDLRIRVVREVAGKLVEAERVFSQNGAFRDELAKIQKEKAKFSDEAVEGLKVKASSGLSSEEILKWQTDYKRRMAKFEKKEADFANEKLVIDLKGDSLQKDACNAMKAILDDMRYGKYGRGEIEINREEIRKVFGRIEELGESLSALGFYVGEQGYVTLKDVENLKRLCVEGFHAPLISLSVKMMPLDKVESALVCKKRREYDFIARHIQPEFVLWDPGIAYLVLKTTELERYIAPLNLVKNDLMVVDIINGIFPAKEIRVLGRIPRDNEAIKDLAYSTFHCESFIPVADNVSGLDEVDNTIRIIRRFLSDRHPGLIFMCPQIDTTFV